MIAWQSSQKKYHVNPTSILSFATDRACTLQVSVVIPVFNRESTIERAIDSVFSQTFSPCEIIVVDDGSTDSTATRVKQYAEVSCLQQTNQGVSAARNTGIKAAQGDWIALLDSDDEWLPEKLGEQMQALQQPQVDQVEALICHCNEIWIRNGKRVNQMKKHAKAGGEIYTNCLPLCVISPSAAIIHRQVFETVGLFDTGLPACEDYDMWLRICSRMPVLYVDKPLLKKYGGHSDQLSHKYPAMDRFRIRAMEKIIRSGSLSPEQLQATRDQLQTKFRIFKQGAVKHGNTAEAEQMQQQLQDLLAAPGHNT